MRKFISNVVLFLSATIVGVAAIESGLRALYPISLMNVDTDTGRGGLFLPDPTLGWRPALGTHLYDETGILVSRSIYGKAAGIKVLLIGDSVTARAQLVDGLANLMPAETLLNGGIEGYNIEQETEFFFRYQSGLSPDAIIQQMHINDLHPTRYLMRQHDGTVRSYSPRLREVDINPILYQYSQLYRFLIANLSSRYSKNELKAAAVDSLRRMRDYTRQNGIPYYLVLFPILQPLNDWTAYDRETRDYLLNVARELGRVLINAQP